MEVSSVVVVVCGGGSDVLACEEGVVCGRVQWCG